jgi:hypothetical protein
MLDARRGTRRDRSGSTRSAPTDESADLRERGRAFQRVIAAAMFCYYKQELVKQTAAPPGRNAWRGGARVHNALDIITASRGSFTIPCATINFLSRAPYRDRDAKRRNGGPRSAGRTFDILHAVKRRDRLRGVARFYRLILAWIPRPRPALPIAFSPCPFPLAPPSPPSPPFTLHSRMNYHRAMVLLSLRSSRVPISSILCVYLAITGLGLSPKSRGERINILISVKLVFLRRMRRVDIVRREHLALGSFICIATPPFHERNGSVILIRHARRPKNRISHR